MNERLETMAAIQQEKEQDLQAQEQHPLNVEGREMACHKKETIDTPYVVSDPLR